MNKAPPPEGFDDNPEWTDATSARAKPASELLPAHAVSALTKRGRGRPSGSDKERISLRVDREVLDKFKAGGELWQTRMNEALRKAVGL
jgi:uncharacterized protein (DUF4415 family)